MKKPMSQEEWENTLSTLPKAYISEKQIQGTTRFYLQWRDKQSGHIRSKYIPSSFLKLTKDRLKEKEERESATDPHVKKILLIATGGTIASKKTEGGLAPEINSEELLSYLDDMSDICEITGYSLYNLDSTNMRPENWLGIARFIQKNYSRYDGFVITHGTDTMAYTGSALSYLIQNSQKPIVLTGSQKSIYMRDSDARNNLSNALLVASNPLAHGVMIVFDDKIIAGTRAKKNRTKSYNAFSSINFPELGVIRDRKVVFYMENPYQEKPKFCLKINPSVFVLRLIPGLDLKIFDFIEENYDALIVESFGVGGIPMYYEKEFSDALEKLILAHKTIIITTQVPYEGSDMSIYQVGKKIKEKYELLEGYDMTIESLVTKIMVIRAMTNDPQKIKRLLYTPINHDCCLGID